MNNRRIITVLLAFCAMLVLPLCAFAAADAKQAAPSGTHQETMSPEGGYLVYVLKEGEWKEAGKLSFDKFFRSEKIDLGKYITGDGSVNIRLVQTGGGAAHIDAVILGDRPPVKVHGTADSLALKKLSRKDFDVVDAFQKIIEVTFPAGTGNIMSLTARVEGTRISKIPFQFPLSNLYKKMTGDVDFYRYRLMTGESYPGKAAIPDMSEKPFFNEYSATGSGHPAGFTYGWVRNDDKNLYVKIDFTSDNTMDGDKDYSKVYVKTVAGVKEFKVSIPETKWGRPDFTYTDKVAYQHKVYDFEIPLKEIGIEDVKKGKEVMLAFAAYGTSSAQTANLVLTPATATNVVGTSHTVTVMATTSSDEPVSGLEVTFTVTSGPNAGLSKTECCTDGSGKLSYTYKSNGDPGTDTIQASALVYGGLDGPDTIYSPPVTKTWVEPDSISVDIDIKPVTCANSFNVTSKGLLPVAILGSSTFDVAHIDPATVRLQGVAPVRWAYKDVATPFNGSKEVCTDCTIAGPDGWMDLVLHFDNTAIASALGPVSNGNCLLLSLTGNLKAEFDSTDIEGSDVLLIVKRK